VTEPQFNSTKLGKIVGWVEVSVTQPTCWVFNNLLNLEKRVAVASFSAERDRINTTSIAAL